MYNIGDRIPTYPSLAFYTTLTASSALAAGIKAIHIRNIVKNNVPVPNFFVIIYIHLFTFIQEARSKL